MGGSQKFTYDLFQYLYVKKSPPKFSYSQQLILFCVAVERQTMRKTILFSHPTKKSIESYFNLVNNVCSVYINGRF